MLLPLELARGLPRAAYLDETVFAFDRAHLFERSWQCVGRECELESPGEFLLTRVAGQELVLVRGVDLELRAFFNVCRHRGLALVEAERGRAREFVCPYHAWTYELSGALRLAPHMPATFQRDCHGLQGVSVGVLHGFVFVCLSAQPRPLSDALSGAPEWLRRPELRHVRLGRSKRYQVLANWKLCVENFQESHHFPSVHPALERQTPSAGSTSWLSDGPWLGGKMRLAAQLRTVAAEGTASMRPFIVPDMERSVVSDAFAFPSLLTSVQPDYLLTYRLEPESPSRTLITANTYFHSAAFSPELRADDVFAFWDTVNAEDRAICERQQRGVASRGFQPAPYSLLEEGVHAFDQRMARCYLGGLQERRA